MTGVLQIQQQQQKKPNLDSIAGADGRHLMSNFIQTQCNAVKPLLILYINTLNRRDNSTKK